MMIVGGLAGIGLLNLAAAATPSFAVLLLLRIACSLAAALVGPTSSTVAAMLAPPDKRGRAMAVVLAGLTLAFIVGIPLGSAIGRWRSTFLFAGCLALVAALVTFIVVPPVAGAASADLRRLSVGLRPDLFAMLMLTMIGFAATFTVIAYIGPVAAEIAGVEGAGVAGLQALIGVGSIIGIVIGGRYADRAQAMHMVSATFVTSAVALSGYSWLTWTGVPPRCLRACAGDVWRRLVGAYVFQSAQCADGLACFQSRVCVCEGCGGASAGGFKRNLRFCMYSDKSCRAFRRPASMAKSSRPLQAHAAARHPHRSLGEQKLHISGQVEGGRRRFDDLRNPVMLPSRQDEPPHRERAQPLHPWPAWTTARKLQRCANLRCRAAAPTRPNPAINIAQVAGSGTISGGGGGT